MTHDELVQFAARKVNVELISDAILGFVFDRDGDGGLWQFDLTSPDLFLKGLAVCPYKVLISVGSDPHERYLAILPPKGDFAMRWYDKPREIPELFWWSLAEIKGGKG